MDDSVSSALYCTTYDYFYKFMCFYQLEAEQHDFDSYQTSDGVVLRMKIGLSVGKVEIHYIGNEECQTFDVTGDAIDDVNKAQSLARSNTVILSNPAWEMYHCFH